MSNHVFEYAWDLKGGYPLKNIDRHKIKVFGMFVCGGGSTMGYKLAGFDHLGGCEIDKKISEVYKKNHNPKFFFNEDIKVFLNREDYPEELNNLDILDGSPPCSSFSVAGDREKYWGKEKKFREGQAFQVLDDLFFTFIKLAKKLRPKVVIAENVKGLIFGKAIEYAKKIYKEFNEAGYDVQVFLLDASKMGVPQKRERLFFICRRKDLNFLAINLSFNEREIVYGEIEDDCYENKISKCYFEYFLKCAPGESLRNHHPKGHFFNCYKTNKNKVLKTITAASGSIAFHYEKHKGLSNNELKLAGSFPADYDFLKLDPKYLIGMSVPPVMMAQIANQVFLQMFKKEAVFFKHNENDLTSYIDFLVRQKDLFLGERHE